MTGVRDRTDASDRPTPANDAHHRGHPSPHPSAGRGRGGARRHRGVPLRAGPARHRCATAGDKVGLATVYRNLQAMAADGEIDMLRTDEGEAVYRACSTGHHHHLVCRVCGRTVEVEGPTVEAWANKVSAEHGFTDVHHTLEIFGTCADCTPA